MNKQKINIWKVIGIILIVLTALLLVTLVSKVSYSAGYEDGKDGIIQLMKIQYETKNPIITLNSNEMNKELKDFVYFLTTWNYNI